MATDHDELARAVQHLATEFPEYQERLRKADVSPEEDAYLAIAEFGRFIQNLGESGNKQELLARCWTAVELLASSESLRELIQMGLLETLIRDDGSMPYREDMGAQTRALGDEIVEFWYGAGSGNGL